MAVKPVVNGPPGFRTHLLWRGALPALELGSSAEPPPRVDKASTVDFVLSYALGILL